MPRSSSRFQLTSSIRGSRLVKAAVALVAVLCGLLVAGPSLNGATPAHASLVGTGITCVVDTYSNHKDVDGTQGCPPNQYPYDAGVEIDYVAMGDSYSSGESVSPFQSHNFEGYNSSMTGRVAQLVDHCDRSTRAASAVLARNLPSTIPNVVGVDRQFVACSGATTSTLVGANGQYVEKPQIAQLRDIQDRNFLKDADLITLTIGGNDVGFADVGKKCLTTLPSKCGNDAKYDAQVTKTIANVTSKLEHAYADLSAAAGGQASILVAGYPQIFAVGDDGPGCPPFQGPAVKQMRAWATQLNANIKLATQEAGVHYVDVTTAFAGHQLCTKTPWINSFVGRDGGLGIDGSLHPNAQGQAAYAKAYQHYITAWRNAGDQLTPEGLPADATGATSNAVNSAFTSRAGTGANHLNVQAADDPTTDTLAMGALTVTPTDPTACAEQFGTGESVQVEGDGYSPGAPVTLALMPGLPGEVDYPLTADDNGSIDTTVVLPAALAGISLGAGTAGYFESNGPGASATTQTDNSLFVIGDPSPGCGLPVLTDAQATVSLTGSDTPYLDVAGATFAVDGPGLPPSAGAAAGSFAELDLDASDNTVCSAQEPAGVQCANGVLGGLTPDETYTVTQLTAAPGYAVAAPVTVTATEDDTVAVADVEDTALGSDYESGTTAASCLLCVLSGTGTSLSATGSSRVTWAGIGTSNSTSATATTATGSSTLTGQTFFKSGGVKLTGTSHLTTSSPPSAGSTPDPFAWYHLPAQSGTGAVLSATGSQVVEAHPGVYSKITASGNARITLEPGTYVITGGAVSIGGSARLTASGATIYLGCAGYPAPCTGSAGSGLAASGAAVVTLTGGAVGPGDGFALLADPANAAALTVAGSAVLSVDGTIEAPAASLTGSGTGVVSSTGGEVVLSTVAVSGSALVDVEGDPLPAP